MSDNISVAIIGASGYTGAELIRLLAQHPFVRITALTGDSQAGKPLAAIYPHLSSLNLPDVVTLEHVDFSSVDLAFCCLPHATTQAVVAHLPEHLKIIDLSADFRLRDPKLYEVWYDHPHAALHLQQEAVYGLSEHARAAIAKARLIANPGCYPTSALLPLLPLLKAGLIDRHGIIIDAKSGITGAGRSAKQANLFAEIEGGISAYGISRHRHVPEIEQGLGDAAGAPAHITFTPHLMPMNRGILSTIYVHSTVDADAARAELKRVYEGEPFVQVMPAGIAPSTHQVRGTNQCRIGVFDGPAEGQLILVSVIDNLMKGASGQAVQNMNIMFGWPEVTGLGHTALFP